jgi:hypothetical protein
MSGNTNKTNTPTKADVARIQSTQVLGPSAYLYLKHPY